MYISTYFLHVTKILYYSFIHFISCFDVATLATSSKNIKAKKKKTDAGMYIAMYGYQSVL